MLLQIFKKSSILLCAGALLVFTSCGGEEPENTDSGNTATESTTDSPRSRSNTADDNSGNQAMDGTRTNGAENEASQNAPLNTNTEGEVKLNPPHGEPGHDCAVPVGQPLNSASSASSPVINQPVSQPNNNNATANLNPPHGEPGHDCAVPVGEPLN